MYKMKKKEQELQKEKKNQEWIYMQKYVTNL